MNYDATIRELTEKRDFYDAAIDALKKIAVTETAKADGPKVRKPGSGRHKWTPEQKAAASARLKERWTKAKSETSGANGTQPDSSVIQ